MRLYAITRITDAQVSLRTCGRTLELTRQSDILILLGWLLQLVLDTDHSGICYSASLRGMCCKRIRLVRKRDEHTRTVVYAESHGYGGGKF